MVISRCAIQRFHSYLISSCNAFLLVHSGWLFRTFIASATISSARLLKHSTIACSVMTLLITFTLTAIVRVCELRALSPSYHNPCEAKSTKYISHARCETAIEITSSVHGPLRQCGIIDTRGSAALEGLANLRA